MPKQTAKNMQQKTLGKPISLKGYYDGIECSADDYAEPVPPNTTLKEELDILAGFESQYPIIIEDDDSPCPDDCVVIQDHADPNEHCPHCSLISLTMGYTPPYQRK